MENATVTIETSVAYPAKWRTKDGERIIAFTIPFHSDLLPLLSSPPKSVQCYYRNLRFKYSTLTAGTAIKLTAEIDWGKRGGIQLNIKKLEVICPSAQNLSKVSAQMMKKWRKQIEKLYAISGQSTI